MTEITKAERVARERIDAAKGMIKVGSDLHLCEMLLTEISRLRTGLHLARADLNKAVDHIEQEINFGGTE